MHELWLFNMIWVCHYNIFIQIFLVSLSVCGVVVNMSKKTSGNRIECIHNLEENDVLKINNEI